MRFRFSTAAVLLVAVFGFLGQTSTAEARGMTPWDVAALQSVGSAEISPNGQHVAYTVSVPRIPMEDENGPAWAELHVYDVETGTHRPFVTGDVNVSKVTWTPDGSHIAFLAKREGDDKTALYVINALGGEARKVIEHDENIAEYAFNDDATRVAFLAKQGKTEREEKLHEDGFDMEFYEENLKNNQLFTVDVDLGNYRGGMAGEATQVEVAGHPTDLHYRPGHEHVLVRLADDSRIDLRYMFTQWNLIDLATGDVAATIQTEGKLGSAAISPNGDKVAFIGSVDIHDPAEGQLMVASITGGAATNLMPGVKGHVNGVAWKNDDTIVYLLDENVATVIGEISAAGGTPKVLVESGDEVVAAMSLSADGSMMAVRSESYAHPYELFVGRTGRTPERATDLNPWLADIEMGMQVVHEWTARDGVELQGVLIQPVNYQHGRSYPLIAVIHGGPEAHERNGWKTYYSRPGQVAAAQGYFVWYPNYRGSTGRGHEFTLTSQGDPGGAEFDDVVDGVEDLIASGLVTEGQVGITGGSYGGFASAWGATKLSEHFQASVMFVGISEQYSKFGTTDIPRESQLVHQNPRKVYDDWQFFLERSPIFHAKGSKTPLLILHGKDDPRVHPTQSMTMYRYFEHMADAPVRLVWYPGEKHGNRKAAARLDYNFRMMRWMNHFLKEGGTEKPAWDIDYTEDDGAVVGKK